MFNKPFPRRTFLRGMGAAMALPMLDAMTPHRAVAATGEDGEAPVRMAFLYVPNGIYMEKWTPETDGSDFALANIMEPLEKVRHQMTVFSGLTLDKARANGDGPGDHARAGGAFLTASQPRKTAGADIQCGISIDQLAAQRVGKATRFPSLELGIDKSAQAGDCDSGYSCAYSSNIAWASPNTPVAKETNPRAVFERLFGNGDAKEMDASAQRRYRYRKSILDLVTEDAARLKDRLGIKDQQKLDEYFTSVREIELRLDRAVLGDAADIPGASKPAGLTPQTTFGEHIRLMLDMLVLAFQADQTRIATMMFANEGSNRSYRDIGVADGHHNITHHQRDPEKLEKIRQINRLHVEHLAYLLEKMDSVEESNGGTLLDNSMILYASAIGDGDRHNHDELPAALFGKGGGVIKPGRHIRYPKDTPMANLYIAMLDQMGVRVESFGDSTGYLNDLTAS